MALLENQKFLRGNFKLVSRKPMDNPKGTPMAVGLLRNVDGNVQAYAAYGKIAQALLNEKTMLGSELRVLAIDTTVDYTTKLTGEAATKHDLKIVKFWFVKTVKAEAEVAAA